LLQLVFWSVVFELSRPVISAALSAVPSCGRYAGLKTQAGRPVWDEIALSLAMGLQRGATAVMVFAGGGQSIWLLRWGLTSEAAFRLNDLGLAIAGLRRHAGEPLSIRVGLAGYHGLVAALLLAAAASDVYSADPDVYRLCRVLVVSEAALALLVPLQYAFNIVTAGGAKALLYTQALAFLVFLWSRFLWGIRVPSGVYWSLLSRVASSEGALPAATFGVGLLATWVYSGLVAKLFIWRLHKSRFAPNKVKQIRQWFEKNQPDASEDKRRTHLWTSQKISETLLGAPSEMLALRMKAGALCWRRKGKLF